MSNGRKTSASGKTRSAGYRVNSETDQEKYVREVEFEQEEAIQLHAINIREKTEDRMVFRKLPFALWIIGSLILVTAIYMLYTLALGYFGVLYKGPKQG